MPDFFLADFNTKLGGGGVKYSTDTEITRSLVHLQAYLPVEQLNFMIIYVYGK